MGVWMHNRRDCGETERARERERGTGLVIKNGNVTFKLTEERLREEGGKSVVVERENKAEGCRETDGDAEQREV